MNAKPEPKTKSLETHPRRAARHGKIARLPLLVRNELNQRLRNGESGKRLVVWLNELPEVKTTLQREFAGRPITGQNLSDWKKGGYREWLAKIEASDLLSETLTDAAELVRNPSSGQSSREAGAPDDSVADQVSSWFFPFYLAAARARLGAAESPDEQWSILRTILADLSNLRRNDHDVERLRIRREKLKIEAPEQKQITEKEFLDWARQQKDIEHKLWPDRHRMTKEEADDAFRRIFGILPKKKNPPFPAEPPLAIPQPAAPAPVVPVQSQAEPLASVEPEPPPAIAQVSVALDEPPAVAEPPPEEDSLDEPAWIRPRRTKEMCEKIQVDQGGSCWIGVDQGVFTEKNKTPLSQEDQNRSLA